MDWIHCNVCFYQPGQLPKRDFKLTSCGHIFCQCCERSGTIEQCKMCGVKCTTTPLSAQMTKEVQIYFEDPDTMQEKMVKVMDFQKNHRHRLNEFHRKVVEKYQLLKVNFQRLEEENKSLKAELAAYKRNTGNILTPPQPKSEFPLFSKNSQASKVIRMGMTQSRGSTPASPFFATPSHSSQQYRSQKMTPSTPMSDASSGSPVSVASRHSYRSTGHMGSAAPANATSSQQRAYMPGLTPPMNALRSLTVGQQNIRKPTIY